VLAPSAFRVVFVEYDIDMSMQTPIENNHTKTPIFSSKANL